MNHIENLILMLPVPITQEEFNPEFIREHALLSADRLQTILTQVSKILDTEEFLVKIPPSRVYFLGDTHGNIAMSLHACKHLFQPCDNNEKSHTCFDKIVFLGDFVDRGVYSVENINFLMSMKTMFPDRIVLIRGNHETREINSRFDFYDSVIRRYGQKTFELYNHIFSKLPLAVLTWNNIFAVHGGVPENLEHLSDLEALSEEIDPEDRITFQLLWNDPVEKEGWYFRNMRGGMSQRFGRDAFKYFMEKNGIKLVLRAHEPQKKGFREFFDTRLISLDSAERSHGKTSSVFVLEPTGEYRVADTEYYQKDLSEIFP